MALSRHMRHCNQRNITPVPWWSVVDQGVSALCPGMSVITVVHTAGDDGSLLDSPPSTKFRFADGMDGRREGGRAVWQ